MTKSCSLIWILVLLFVAAPRALAQTPDEGEAMLKQMLADAKELAASSLPDRNQLGPEWKLAWELPTAQAKVKTEEEYWQQTAQEMGFAGVSQEFARKMIDSIAQQYQQMGAAEGITGRDGIITLLLRVRGTDAPTAVKICDAWSTGARTFAVAQTMQDMPEGEKSRRGPRAILDLVSKPYEGQSDEQLKQLFARQVSLIQKRTQMSYFRSNDWAGLAQAQSEQEIQKRGLWLGVVKVNLMLADPERTDEPLDLRAEDAPKLESQLQSAVRASVAGALKMRRKDVEKQIARKKEFNDIDGAREIQEKFNAEVAAASQLQAKVVMKQFGDNSYVVRITGVSPDTAGMEFGMYRAWIRKGPAMVEISLGGNFPEEQMNKEMDRFLSEMDAKLASYDSAPAGVMQQSACATS